MKKYKNASEIRVGVIGYGGAFNMGRAHLNEMKQAGMTPVAVSQTKPKKKSRISKSYFNKKLAYPHATKNAFSATIKAH